MTKLGPMLDTFDLATLGELDRLWPTLDQFWGDFDHVSCGVDHLCPEVYLSRPDMGRSCGDVGPLLADSGRVGQRHGRATVAGVVNGLSAGRATCGQCGKTDNRCLTTFWRPTVSLASSHLPAHTADAENLGGALATQTLTMETFARAPKRRSHRAKFLPANLGPRLRDPERECLQLEGLPWCDVDQSRAIWAVAGLRPSTGRSPARKWTERQSNFRARFDEARREVGVTARALCFHLLRISPGS